MSPLIPLSRSTNVYCIVSFLIKPNTLRQLGTFKFLPYFIPSHVICSLFPNVSLLFDGVKMLAGDPKFEIRFGPAPRHSDCCGRAEYTAHSVRQKNMVCKRGENVSSRCQDGKPPLEDEEPFQYRVAKV